MQKHFTIAILTMVMVIMFAIPVYANGGGYSNDMNEQNQEQQQGQIQGQFQIAEGGEGGQGGTAYGGKGGSVCYSGNNFSSNNADNSNKNKQVNKQEVNIENPDELKVNSQLNPMAGQQTNTIEYHGETLEDHKYQNEILKFLLSAKGLKPFKVKEHGFFTRKSSHSTSRDLSVKKYDETTTVYVFRDMVDLEENINNYSIVGFADTFSKGKASLMDCFDQGVIDAGEMGGNILVFLDIGYTHALKSTTTGLGGSGASGFMKNATQSTVFGAALGYASSKAVPETDPFIHGMILYSDEIPVELAVTEEKPKPVDRFATE